MTAGEAPEDSWAHLDLGHRLLHREHRGLADLMALYFDADFYNAANPDVAQARVSAEAHYLKRGWREGRRPNPYFDPAYYRNVADGWIPGEMPELEHYASTGWLQGVSPSADFDVRFYTAHHPDVIATGMEPLAHFLAYGQAEGRASRSLTADFTDLMSQGSHPSLLAEQHLKLLDRPRAGSPRQSEYVDTSRLRLDWIIPDFAPGAGGHRAIFKAIYWLEQLGHQVTIWLDYPNNRSGSLAVAEDILRHFVPLNAAVRLLEPRDVIDTDVLIATDRWTVWSAMRHGNHKLLAYFVQDYEPWFYPVGADYFLAAHTYDLRLLSICSSAWLEQRMAASGSITMGYTYPADPEFYYPSDSAADADSDAPLIAFYARPATGRRAVELAVLGLIELARRGVKFRVAMYGQDLDPNSRWPFPVQLLGVLSEAELGDLFRRADLGLALSATNYSIASVEMMACGLPIVDLETESTLATYPADAVTLALPNPTALADAIHGLLADLPRRTEQGEAGLRWVSGSRWPEIATRMAAAFAGGLRDAGYSERPSPAFVAQRVRTTVAIPTFNGERRLEETLQALERQLLPWEYRVLCIDSGSTDATLEILSRHPAVLVHEIPSEEFGHGATRNLACELADSDYVAFLTQDAVPASPTWLFDLVTPLRAIPGAAGSFGRHLPHDGASAFVRRDLREHFALFRNAPLIVNRDTDRARFEAKDPGWLGFVRFFSNNNSCLDARVWEKIPFPTINFGEDQVWAWHAILAGFSKVYVDKAAVHHSHDYGPAETFKRARTESAFFRLVFGADSGVPDEATAEYRVRELMARDIAEAMREAVSLGDLRCQLSLNAAQIAGRLAGNADTSVQY